MSSEAEEMGRLVAVETSTIDTVLALRQQMGRVAGVDPVYPETALDDDPAMIRMD